jgi:hypothetical protein
MMYVISELLRQEVRFAILLDFDYIDFGIMGKINENCQIQLMRDILE